MTRITLGKQQGIALGGLVALLLVASTVSLVSTRVLKARFDETIGRTVVRLELVYDLRELIGQSATAERDFAAAAALDDRATAAAHAKTIDLALAEAQRKAAELRGRMRIESGRQAAANLQQLLQLWRDRHDEVLKTIAAGKAFQTDSFTEKTARLADDMRGALEKILSNQQTFLQEDAASANRAYGVSTLIVMALILVSFLVGGKGTELHQLAAKLDEKVRQRTAELTRSEARFRDLLENASDLIQSVDPDGRFLFVNRAWKETLGYTEEDISRLTMFDVLDDSCKEHCQEMFRGLMAGEDVPHMQAVFVGKHGRRVSVEGSVNCRLEDGRPVATRGIFHDVTARKRSEEQFQRLLESAPDAMVIVNRGGNIILVNSQAETLFGYPRAELLGRSVELLVPARFRGGHAAHRDAFVAAPAARRKGSRELYGLRRDGSEVSLEISLSPLETEDGALVISAIRDVTENKRVEAELRQAKTEAEAASRAKSEFLATMSHEIRTPMNGVVGAVGLLLDGELTPRQRELATIARSSAHSLLTLINDILDISKIEAGKMPVEQAPFDLLATLEDVGTMFAERAEEKGVELVLRYAPDARRRFVGDASRIRQVLVNLVGNAIKFSEGGHVLVSVEEERSAEGEPLAMLRFATEDTGIGISPEAVSRLFERFVQADASTTRRFGGTGLGLAICKRLVELMGGQIGVTSRVGEGSTFWFTLPLLMDASPAPAPRAADIAAARVLPVDDNTAARHAADAVIASPARPCFRGRVLVADDNTTNQRVAQLALEGLSCHVELAGNGAEALAMLQQRPYDLVFMDCEMPEVDGFEATREIRASEARLARGGSPAPRRRIPVVAMTAKVLSGDREKCLAAGMDDYLSKPVQLNTLLDVLERWLPVEARPDAGEPSAWTTPRAERPDVPRAVTPSGALDRAVIDRLMMLAQQTTPALFVRVLEAFLSDAPKYLTALQAAAARRDPAGLGRAAHALKGASLNVGAPTMAEMSRQLETVEEGGLADIAPVLAQLESEFQRVKAELERELDQEQAVENSHR